MHDLRQFDLNLLVALEALLTEGSVTGAARLLGVGQPAMSHSLKRLREHFDDELLVRDGNVMRRTPRAEALRPEVENAFVALRRVMGSGAAFEPSIDTRTFRVAMTEHVALLLAGPLAERLAELAPATSLHIAPLSEAERDVGRELDLAIGYFEHAPEALRRSRLFTERYQCFVREGHPALEGWGAEAYVSYPHVLISPRGGVRGAVDVALERVGRRRRIQYLVPHHLVAPRVVATTDAILTATRRLSEELCALAPLVTLEPPIPVDDYAISMVWHERTQGDAGARWLREQVRAVAKQVADDA